MKISIVGISLSLLVVIIYFGSVSSAYAGPDITPPTLNSVSIISDNVLDMTLANVTDTVTLTFTADENIMTPVVMIDGNPADSVMGGPIAWIATRVMQAGDTDAPIAFTIDFTDLAGNMGIQVTTTTDASSVIFDEIAPMVTASAITAGNTVTIVYDEPVISSMGDYSDLNLIPSGARAVTGHGGSGTTTITLTFGGGAAIVNEVGTIDIGIGITDLAGNAITSLNDLVVDDGQAPSLNSVSIISDNVLDMTLANVTDTVTLTFTSNENLMMTPVVTIGGLPAIEAGAGTAWSATRVMSSAEPNGPLAFTIDFSDLAGNMGTTVTATTDASSVIFDDILPTLNPVSISSSNTDPLWANVTDTVTLTFTENEDLLLTPVVTIGGNMVVPVELLPTEWTATRVMAMGDTEAQIAFTIDTTDLAGNVGIQVTGTTDGSSVTFDETPPMVTAGAIISNNDFAILYNEPVTSTTGDYTDLMIDVNPKTVIGSTTGSATIFLTFNTPPNSNADDTGRVDILPTLTDLAGNSISFVNNQVLADGQTPTLNPVSISSNNADPVWAKVGDTVTLTFTSNENLMMTPVVTIGGLPAIEAGAGTAWSATRVMSGAEPNGSLGFTISYSDLVGNAGMQTTTTDTSSVSFDDISPTVTSSSIISSSIVSIVYDEPVLTTIGDYSALVIAGFVKNINSLAFGAPDTILLSFSTVAQPDDTGSITIGAGVTDRAGNFLNMPGNYQLPDGQPPQEPDNVSIGRGSAPSFSSSSFDSSVTMSPISINGKHYNFIQSGNLIPLGTIATEDNISEEPKVVKPLTNVIKVGQLTNLKFVTFTNYGADHIQHVAIYTNLKGTSVKPSSDTIGIIYEKGKELKILDENGILSHADIKVSGEGNRVDIKVNIIFSNNMETSDLVLRMWDKNRYPLYAHIEDAWKVIGKPELEEEPTVENPIKEIQKEETISAIKKWAGYDLEVVSDSELLNTIGITGDNIPKWLKISARWIVNEEISLEEFVDALRFVQNIKV